MDKGQENFKISSVRIMLILSLFVLISLAACQAHHNSHSNPINQPTDTPRLDHPVEGQTTASVSAPPEPLQDTESITPTPSCPEQGGMVKSAYIYSERLGDDLHFRVYFPPCYHVPTNQRYPVVYLLHGLYFSEDQWLRLGIAELMDRLIADSTMAPFIIILPGEVRFDPLQTSGFADALTEELIPWVDQHYRTLPEKQFRAIGGVSRGAAWSVRIGLLYYMLFESVGAHSLPSFEVKTGTLTTILRQVPSDDLPIFFIDVGNRDPERSAALAFAEQLNEHNIPHTWYLFNGGHTEAYWSAHLEHYLRWYSRNW